MNGGAIIDPAMEMGVMPGTEATWRRSTGRAGKAQDPEAARATEYAGDTGGKWEIG